MTDESSMQLAIDTIIEPEGRIDVLVNNAGYGSYGAIEDVTIEEAKQQFEVNVFGLARLTQLVLPHMREQRSGRIINTSSMGGRLTTYFGAWYHATKYAIEAFSIDVSVIEPGSIKTDWGFIAADKLSDSAKGGPYEEAALKTSEGMKKQYSSNMLSNPIVVTKAINSNKLKTRYLIGFYRNLLSFYTRFCLQDYSIKS